MRRTGALLLALLAGVALPVLALDYRSAAGAAVLYDAPSHKAKPLFVLAAGTPVEVIVALDAWLKVRDSQGDLAWIERRLVADKRMLLVRPGGAQIRAMAQDEAALVFVAEANVLLEFVEPTVAGWLKVRHRDGLQGFVKVGQVWGY